MTINFKKTAVALIMSGGGKQLPVFNDISKQMLRLGEPFLLMAVGVSNVDSTKTQFQIKSMDTAGGSTTFFLDLKEIELASTAEKIEALEFVVKSFDGKDEDGDLIYNKKYKMSSDGKTFFDVIFVQNKTPSTTSNNNADGLSSGPISYMDQFEIKIVGQEIASVVCIGDTSKVDRFECMTNSNVGDISSVKTFTLFEPLSATCKTVDDYVKGSVLCTANEDNGKSKNKRQPINSGKVAGKVNNFLSGLNGGIENVKEKVVSVIPKTPAFQWLADLVKGIAPMHLLFLALFIFSCLFFIFAKMFMILLFFVTFSIGGFLVYEKFKDYKIQPKKKNK